MMEQIYLFAGFGAVPTRGEIYISPLLAAGDSSTPAIMNNKEQISYGTMQAKSGAASAAYDEVCCGLCGAVSLFILVLAQWLSAFS